MCGARRGRRSLVLPGKALLEPIPHLTFSVGIASLCEGSKMLESDGLFSTGGLRKSERWAMNRLEQSLALLSCGVGLSRNSDLQTCRNPSLPSVLNPKSKMCCSRPLSVVLEVRLRTHRPAARLEANPMFPLCRGAIGLLAPADR